jgi:hypothetical protein
MATTNKPLTYTRLITTLQALICKVNKKYRTTKDASRANALRTVLNNGIIAVQAGLSGDASVPAAGNLKHEVQAKIQRTHKLHDGAAIVVKYAGMGRQSSIEAYLSPKQRAAGKGCWQGQG